ncbi:MAG: aromatic ring-hydroxylating dioxygenase subunit alpha [Acidobacteriota bacterium]
MERTATRLLPDRTSGFSLEQRFYRDPDIFELDLESIHLRQWLFAGHSSRIPKPGDYFLFEFAGESIIVVRGPDLEIHAFFNVCRHRGSRLCREKSGNVRGFVCPYHHWTYRLDGRLVSARSMPEDFSAENNSLETVHTQTLEGMIFLSLGVDPPDFEPVKRDVLPHLRPHGLAKAKICHTSRYDIRANWKLVVENSRECYHCPPAHPEYCRIMGFAAGIDSPRIAAEDEVITRERMAHWNTIGLETRVIDFTESTWHHAIRMPFRKGHFCQSLDGKAVAPLMGTLTERDVGALAVILYPTFWFEASADYAMIQRFLPVAPELTTVEINWLVDEAATEGVDYDVDRVTAFWRATAEQDRAICEDNQAGVNSRHYRPGRYSLVEAEVDKFLRWYLAQVRSETGSS